MGKATHGRTRPETEDTWSFPGRPWTTDQVASGPSVDHRTPRDLPNEGKGHAGTEDPFRLDWPCTTSSRPSDSSPIGVRGQARVTPSTRHPSEPRSLSRAKLNNDHPNPLPRNKTLVDPLRCCFCVAMVGNTTSTTVLGHASIRIFVCLSFGRWTPSRCPVPTQVSNGGPLLEALVGCPPLLWMVDQRERHPSHGLVARQPSSSYTARVAMAMGSVGPSVRLVDARRGEERHGGG